MARSPLLYALLGACLALALVAPAAAAPPPGYTDADYFAFADRMVQRLDSTWDEADGYYKSGSPGLDSRYNASFLVIHATAAAHGWTGPARNDARARSIASRLTDSPPFYTARTAPWDDPMFHTPGWIGKMEGDYDLMDKAIDPKIAEGLQIAWRARHALGLGDATAGRIVDQVRRVAHVPFYRYPAVRLNQINWPAELYLYEYLVTGDPHLLRTDYRKQMRRFVRGIRRPWLSDERNSATNLSPTFRFHYQINQSASSSRNLDSAEYANMTLHFLAWYDDARAVGMDPLSGADKALLRGWVQRDLFGYWMHSGMMNWDSGLGYGRWMKIKTWAYALQGLVAIADATTFQNYGRMTPWAKTLFDRGLRFYERQNPNRAGMFGINERHRDGKDTRFTAARVGATAARAVSGGMGQMPSAEPPPFYAFDPDVGRLAVSTPNYGTAVVAVRRHAFPYGGIELARLHDAQGDPIAGIGGEVPAAFGVVVRDSAGRKVMVSQRGRVRTPRRAPVVVTDSPRGRISRMPRRSSNPPAEPFRVLGASGTRSNRRLSVTTRHRFTEDSIEESWTVRRRFGGKRYDVEVLFPSWGRNASIDAQLDDGTVVPLADHGAPQGAVNMADVARFNVRGERGGYYVTPLGEPGGQATAVRVDRQRSAPKAGPTLKVILRRGSAFESARFRARITPK
jgi:hypothetical protein